MSNEIKGVSFRLGEEDIQKFREFAEEQGLNQAEMFQALVNNFEMAKAKGMMIDRAKEIETFQATVNNLVGMFVNSLAVNQTSEERIREMLNVELSSKDKTIISLQERVTQLVSQLQTKTEDAEYYFHKMSDIKSQAESMAKDIIQKDKMFSSQQSQIDSLNQSLSEHKVYKEKYIELETDNSNLQKQNTELMANKADLENRLANTESMKIFYQGEVETLRAENKDIRMLMQEAEKAHRDELTALRAELDRKYTKEFEEKLEFEKSKMKLEMDKLAAKSKAAKPAKNSKTTNK